MERIKTLWRWIGNFSTGQFLWSLAGAGVMGTLTWLAAQPIWHVALVALGSAGIISIIWARVAIIRLASRQTVDPAPANTKQPRRRATEMAAEEINHSVQWAGTPQSASPIADVFALPFKHMFEQTAAQLEAQHAKKMSEIRDEVTGSQRQLVAWIPLCEALRYLVYDSQWAQTQPTPTDRNDFNKRVSVEFIERLARGDITARGKLGWTQESLSRPTEPIDSDYWVSAFMQPHGEIVLASPDTQGTVGCKASDETYRSVIVQKGQVELAWPQKTRSDSMTALARFVEPMRAKIAEEKGSA